MNKLTFALCGFLLAANFSFGQDFGKLKNKVNESLKTENASSLSEGEVVSGLKEALNKGVEKGVSQLSKPDGYFKDPTIKIPLPQEAKDVESKLRQMGQGEKVDEAIESINRAAEDAAMAAKDIFIDAIKNMSVTDAMGLLKGNDDAATRFLESSTRAVLVEKFRPIIKVSLEKVGATKHWNSVFTTYNKIPLVKKVNPDLEEYATNKAIDGLFVQIAKEELEIRKNPGARVTDLFEEGVWKLTALRFIQRESVSLVTTMLKNMTTSTILILVAIGMLAGVLSGFVGVGGGVLIVPALIYAFGMSQHEAQGTSLFVLLLPVGILAVNNYWKAESLNWKFGLIIAITFVIGGYIGSKLSLKFSPALIKFIFGIIMAYVAFRFIVTGYNGLSNES